MRAVRERFRLPDGQNSLGRGFTLLDTNASKGVGICLVLMHHLFYQTPHIGLTIHGVSIAYYLGAVSKVSVAIFIFLSGYGINESIKNKQTGLLHFYLKRFSRIYATYWLVWLIFVPVSFYFFGRTFVKVYGNDFGLKLLGNFFGLQTYFNYWGYNPTWWFVTLILSLYFIFPFVKTLNDKYGLFFLSITSLFLFVPEWIKGISIGVWVLFFYLFSFNLGIYFSSKQLFVEIDKLTFNKYAKFILYILLLIVLVWQRQNGIFAGPDPRYESAIDGILSVVIICFGYEYLYKIKTLRIVLPVIGKHSYNIFLFHTFILAYYLTDFIKTFVYPVLMFIVLLAICMALSFIVELIKKYIGINYLARLIENIHVTERVYINSPMPEEKR